jgi:hypothetical protein
VTAPLERLTRGWWSIELPGFRPHLEERGTYSPFPRDTLPPVGRALDADLRWLLAEPPVPGSLARGEIEPARPATGEDLARLLRDDDVPLPSSFVAFVSSPEPRTRVRSCTDCYLDLADFVVPVPGGGSLVHFLSDSQWVLHWLLYAGPEGAEAVVAAYEPFGFEDEDESIRAFDAAADEAWMCADTFSEFLYRFWIENEIWFALAYEKRPLTDEQRRYAEHYLA